MSEFCFPPGWPHSQPGSPQEGARWLHQLAPSSHQNNFNKPSGNLFAKSPSKSLRVGSPCLRWPSWRPSPSLHPLLQLRRCICHWQSLSQGPTARAGDRITLTWQHRPRCFMGETLSYCLEMMRSWVPDSGYQKQSKANLYLLKWVITSSSPSQFVF